MPYGGLLGSNRTRSQGSRGYMRYQALECAKKRECAEEPMGERLGGSGKCI